MEMFTSFKKVMADPEITTAGKSVFLNLLSRMDKKGYCYPAVNTMEDETGYCERTIQRQTNKLAEKGYIVKAEQKAMGKQFTNRYYLTPEDKRDFLFNDNDIKEVVRKNSVFQDFLKMEEVIVTTEYKHPCLHLVYRSMKITKLEKLVLAYFIMRADQEAFTYFSVERLSGILRIPFFKLRRVIKTLIYRKLLRISQQIIEGETVIFARICIEKFGLKSFVRKCVKLIRHTYSIQDIKIYLYIVSIRTKTEYKEIQKKYRFHRILQKIQMIQDLDRHVLF